LPLIGLYTKALLLSASTCECDVIVEICILMLRSNKIFKWKPSTACNDGCQCYMLSFMDYIMVLRLVIWCHVFCENITKVCRIFLPFSAMSFYCL